LQHPHLPLLLLRQLIAAMSDEAPAAETSEKKAKKGCVLVQNSGKSIATRTVCACLCIVAEKKEKKEKKERRRHSDAERRLQERA